MFIKICGDIINTNQIVSIKPPQNPEIEFGYTITMSNDRTYRVDKEMVDKILEMESEK